MARNISPSDAWDSAPYLGGIPSADEALNPPGALSTDDLAGLLSLNPSLGAATELGRDLQLKHLVEQACLATSATSAAIALVRGDQLICRASTGSHAPGLGVVLNIEYGLSAICVRTLHAQRCDDTETDPRVNASACRRLGVRSVLVIPMIYGDFLLGIFEIFSPHPRAFGERDEQTLLALAFRVLFALGISSQPEHAEHAPEPQIPPPAAVVSMPPPIRPKDILLLREPVEGPPRAPIVEAKPGLPQPQPHPEATVPPERVPSSESYPQFAIVRKPQHDLLTPVLTTLVIGLALSLGWVLGHGPTGVRSAQFAREQIKAALSQSPTPPVEVHAASPSPKSLMEKINPQPAAMPHISSPPAKTQPVDGLVVYKGGRMIFRQPNQVDRPGAPLASWKAPVKLAPSVAETFLTHRVEPNYPEEARHRHIQGPVVLGALVDEDGSVQQLRVISGKPELASAAIDAVRLWKFKPYQSQGHHLQFETEITVNFALPSSTVMHN